MPKIEYTCRKCSRHFQILVFRGDKELPVFCPECGNSDVKADRPPDGLFEGIAAFSSLNQDHN